MAASYEYSCINNLLNVRFSTRLSPFSFRTFSFHRGNGLKSFHPIFVYSYHAMKIPESSETPSDVFNTSRPIMTCNPSIGINCSDKVTNRSRYVPEVVRRSVEKGANVRNTPHGR